MTKTIARENKTKTKKTIAVFYMEDIGTKEKLRKLAFDKGHNSIGKLIREMTQTYVDKHWKEGA